LSFSQLYRCPPALPSFPTRRSSDLLRAVAEAREEHAHLLAGRVLRLVEDDERVVERAPAHERERRHLDLPALLELLGALEIEHVDRKSTRLNSSHVKISYAVFCLKK